MSYTDKDWFRDVALDTIGFLTPEERLRGLQADEILRNLKPEEVLRNFKPEEIKSYLNGIQN